MLEFQIGVHMTLSERITMDPEICHGKPTIRGLRYTVESILELLSSGMAIEEILSDYEDLERDDILAALDFARQLSQIKRIEPIVAWSFLIDAQLPRRLAHQFSYMIAQEVIRNDEWPTLYPEGIAPLSRWGIAFIETRCASGFGFITSARQPSQVHLQVWVVASNLKTGLLETGLAPDQKIRYATNGSTN